MTRLQVALALLLGAMVALPAAAQQVDLDDELWQPEPEMGVQIERRDAGQFYDSELQRWFDADDTGAEPVADTGRMADTSVPGWEYNPATRLWHDTQRPGWAWDPMTGRWYNSDRPGQAYDMRTGRWYPTTPGGMYYDSDQQRWYFDPQVAAMRGQGRETVSYFDQETNERWIPYVIEPAAGLGRAFMAFLIDAYHEDEAPNAKGGVDTRVVLKLDRRLAPVKVAVLPLSKKPELAEPAQEIAAQLRQLWNVEYDTSGAIGRRYRRQDEIGTPFCVTVDFDTLEDNAVTVRERDTMAQERIKLEDLQDYLATRLVGC